MKTRILLTLAVLIVSTLAFAQKSVPTCNSFDTTGAPIFTATPPSTTGTTLCTDFFGKGNYANSPLPAGPIDTVTGFTIVDGGSGYTAPVVTIGDALGTPTNGIPVAAASCSATLTGDVITAITCASAGSGYVAPVVSVTDPTGSGAFILAKLSTTGLSGGIRKFVDLMPDLKGAIATPDTTTFPGSDYYEIALVETTWPMHSDLPPTTVRGYVQVPTGTTACPVTPVFNYLGPVLVAAKNRPVRVKFTNCLATGPAGSLFIPVDTTYMGAGLGPDNTPYTENRATLHLHGGATPWISDGTPHQWTVPAGEVTNFKKGVSTQNVPDMFFATGGAVVPQCSATVTTNCSGGTIAQLPVGATNDPGDGSMTFYWTNQQGGRLMFYHDHAYGITRLNVYAGEAAGYYLYDPAEEAALAAATVPGTVTDLPHLIPLVIQDKTFVPSAAQLAGQDPTWIWGTANLPATTGFNGNAVNGDLWFPHVYMPNQNPADQGSANAFGRWDYGAWFFPPQTILTAAGPGGPNGDPHGGVTIPCTSAAFPNQVLTPSVINNFFEGCPITPNPSGTPEGFMDTPLVNGKAYPILHVAPEAYRFQVLSAANDRSWNLQLYVADATGKEVPTLPAVPPAATTPLPLCGSITKITQPTLGLGLPYAALDSTGNPINGTGLPLNCWPNYGAPSPGISSKQFMWPADGRDGGVPDPRFAGPPIIQIGTEGGLLPAPAVIPSTPVNYEVNTRSITITNVSTHGLWLGPAERADVIIDFSKFSGKTLILYNDAPTPTPAFDMRDDYYTGDLDESTTGGAPQTLPGYGPNTRTIMQIVVDAPATATTPFNLASLQAALPAVFAATQPVPIVPEPTYPVASGGHSATTHYARVSDRALTFSPASLPVTSITVSAGGTGYSATTTVSIAAPGCVAPCATATAIPTIVGGVITAITVVNGGSGYTAAPLVTITDPAATGTGAAATANITTTYTYDQKAIQELFTLDYGRMNATLGTELPLTSFQLQTTLPYGYAEWATEILQDGQTQLWYLTHNGVDTHFIHFHLFNVQVINRVGWDGSIRPPDQNELGWKDTVRMNPLENIVVAIQSNKQILPFPLPDSIRSLDVTLPDGVVSPAISGIDPATGNAITGGLGTVNAKVNFGQEYVWHCHILGHEENDMMRPMIFQVAPPAPSNFVAILAASGTVNLTWTDNAASESGFNVQRDTDPLFPAPVTVLSNASPSIPSSAFGGTITATDNPPVLQAGQSFYYRLQSEDDFRPQSPLAGIFQTVPLFSAWVSTKAGIATVTTILAPPITYGQNGVVTVTVTSAAGTVTGNVTLSVDGGAPISQALSGGSAIFTLPTPAVGTHTLAASFLAQGAFAASSATGTLVVSPAPLTITASSATVPYGSAIPAITPNVVGLVSPDTAASLGPLVCSTTAIQGSPFGSYPTTCSGAVNANYTITYVAGSVTITAVPLTITANNATRSFGAPNPTFTATYATFVNGDTPASLTGTLSCTTTATATSPAGTYPITCSGQTSVNYTITYVPGTLTVTAAGPVLTLNPTALTFSSTPGVTTVAQTITVTNTGGAALRITGITLAGVNPFRFGMTQGCPINGAGLAAGGSCTISVTFTPNNNTNRSASVRVAVAAPAVTGTVTLTGTTVRPVAALSTASLPFGLVPINTTSAPQTVTLANNGTVPLLLTSITVGGPNPGRFPQTNNCPIGGAGLAPNAFCTITVTFRPNRRVARSATLTIRDNAANSPQTVALTGTGQ